MGTPTDLHESPRVLCIQSVSVGIGLSRCPRDIPFVQSSPRPVRTAEVHMIGKGYAVSYRVVCVTGEKRKPSTVRAMICLESVVTDVRCRVLFKDRVLRIAHENKALTPVVVIGDRRILTIKS